MSSTILAGVVTVNLALLAYSIGIFLEQRRHQITQTVILFLTIGVVCDVVATGLMIAGSSHGPFTLHGLLGFSALAAMVTETVLAWRHRLERRDGEVSIGLHWYSRIAYGWWLVAYITGAILVRTASA